MLARRTLLEAHIALLVLLTYANEIHSFIPGRGRQHANTRRKIRKGTCSSS